eukprot:6188302-Pleurochrysis_carterae.AAC.2
MEAHWSCDAPFSIVKPICKCAKYNDVVILMGKVTLPQTGAHQTLWWALPTLVSTHLRWTRNWSCVRAPREKRVKTSVCIICSCIQEMCHTIARSSSVGSKKRCDSAKPQHISAASLCTAPAACKLISKPVGKDIQSGGNFQTT